VEVAVEGSRRFERWGQRFEGRDSSGSTVIREKKRGRGRGEGRRGIAPAAGGRGEAHGPPAAAPRTGDGFLCVTDQTHSGGNTPAGVPESEVGNGHGTESPPV
jgi:hypothetical protein